MAEQSNARPVDIKAGNLRIRLAETPAEIRESQRLRFQVFCEEMAAKPTGDMVEAGIEYDSFDDYCDHLLVFDETDSRAPAVVGTYRLMRREAARRRGQFYTIDEYDISGLMSYQGEILELGRSCVAAALRNGATMQLLWRGIAAYVFHYNIDIMFGCASLPGTDVDTLAHPLSYLHYHHLAPPALRPRAVAERYVAMDRLAADMIDPKKAWQELPPLFKGYLRLGGFVGDGAVVDREFGTTDVCIVVKTDRVTEKYYRHYSRDEAGRLVHETSS
ncbi:MAG: GNAT family N-acyltransferase [Pseudomonadota bacterium]